MEICKCDEAKRQHFNVLLADTNENCFSCLKADTIKQCVRDAKDGHVAAECILLHAARLCVCAADGFVKKCIKDAGETVTAASEPLANNVRSLCEAVNSLINASKNVPFDIQAACVYAENIIRICATFVGENPDEDADEDGSNDDPVVDGEDPYVFKCTDCYRYVRLCRLAIKSDASADS
jgi:hypothetical protein